jgi:hypothetical protein
MISNINQAGRYIVIHKYREEHGDNATVSLTPEAEIILEWAAKKIANEERIRELAKTNVAVADAVEALNTANEQLKMIVELVK